MPDQINLKEVLNISYPIILGMAAQNIINVTNTAFLGHLGEVELGASALAGLFYVCIFMLGFGFSVGAQILISMRNGERKYRQIGLTFDHSLYFLIFLSTLMIIAVYFGAPFALKSMIHNPQIHTACIYFLLWRILALPFSYLNSLFRAFFVGITETKPLTASAIVTAIVNIFLDYSLIFGHFGLPQLGLIGAAYATIVAEACGSIYLVIYIYYKRYNKQYFLFNFNRLITPLITRILKIATPVMIQHFISLSGWFVFFIIIENMGARALAVSNITRSIYMVLMIPIWSYFSANASLVGNLIGEGKQHLVLKTTYFVAKISLISAAILVVICAILLKPLLSIYTNDQSLINDSYPTMYVIFSIMIVFAYSMLLFSAISGVGKTKEALYIEVFTILVYIASAMILARLFPHNVEFVWFSEFIYFLVIGLISIWYLKRIFNHHLI